MVFILLALIITNNPPPPLPCTLGLGYNAASVLIFKDVIFAHVMIRVDLPFQGYYFFC